MRTIISNLQARKPSALAVSDYSMIEATIPTPPAMRAYATLQSLFASAAFGSLPRIIDYSMIEATMPAPTVRPPSRIA
ncbi:hypothetical protein ACFOVS_21610, partial [Rhizobium lemnae]